MGSTGAETTMLGGSALAWGLLLSLLVLAGALAHLWRLSRSRRQLRSRLRVAHSELSEMRGRDALTGLVTRAAFELLLEPEVLRADREGTPLALLYVGLDGVRAVNESLGLRVGDGLLAQAAHRLSAFVGDAPEVARAGGDEFVLLLRADAPQALAAAAALHELLTRPFTVETHALGLGASIGIACYPEHGSRPRLISHAALAMRTVKLGGGEGQALYDPSMGVNMREQAELLQDLRQALARQELQLYFQPKVDARSLQVTAAEALLRWRHPRRGMISPDVFVPLAERHGLIAGIGAWVIEEACRQAAQWRRKGLRMRIAVNISGLQLRHESLVEQIEEALRRHRIPADRLTCEITETVAMEDTAVTRGAFERLRQAGLHVSIDDFGTGYSSLATLRRLPAEELKIDRAFVADLDLEGKSAHSARTIVRAIVQMAHSLQMRVVAEGVESATQRDELVALGCDELQGYLFARPMPAASLALWADGDGAAAGSMFRPSLFDPTAPAALEAAPGTATT